ncbi:MAG TPA: hypothetical protein VEA80_00065 [Vitreimonas sp.]|uniref:hypothetical protein n=1 Tax=Vitreimonas sp. TaxID=3069702 RepID=UPI002D66614D|nr:hypothetical protein [Vitreimonas sp.]HYD85847.1 hypothetical protein [Vitreimonas sp.]
MRLVRNSLAALAMALTLAACGQGQPSDQDDGSAITAPEDEGVPGEAQREELPPVDASLLGAPNDLFTAIEPSEVGVFGAPSVMEALDPLLGPEVTEGSSVHLTVREEGDGAIADIVRTGLADDSVSAGHVRVEFRREPDGWYPTNAYRRMQCARGATPGEWTTGLCP